MIWVIMAAYQFVVLIADLVIFYFRAILLLFISVYRIFFPAEKKPVAGEIVLITGAGHGIGKEMALQFARLGAKVICLDLNEEWNKQTVSQITKEGGHGSGFQCDVTNTEHIRDVSNKIRRLIGDVTILVNNVGIMPCKPFLRHSEEEIEKIFRVNVFSQFWMIMEWLPTFKANGKGHIVAMSSMCGVIGTPNLAPYCSSKFAITGLIEGLIEELRYGNQNPNIKFTRIHPYTVDTGLAKKPRIKFPSLSSMVSPELCATTAINSILREEEVVFVPSYYYHCYKIFMSVPRKVGQAFVDFMDTGVDSHED